MGPGQHGPDVSHVTSMPPTNRPYVYMTPGPGRPVAQTAFAADTPPPPLPRVLLQSGRALAAPVAAVTLRGLDSLLYRDTLRTGSGAPLVRSRLQPRPASTTKSCPGTPSALPRLHRSPPPRLLPVALIVDDERASLHMARGFRRL
ncbi:hypothetical protein Mp_4g19330 [Marchantia polymorpha subsp. ruderalis]|uniref:Uncharacterized protein n=2 Tax=Marchantia polymorpha TaxID=3197 RepID=A0AAF6BBJ9_MARPO|nr:hypothetical protein MARPO_0169s0011 [Marchantia polymorpha]BBN09383.1 hypothetical protein Mp_4g19330 [Marchantia polymorpha subsp. ruderalis]|eukprot:PTQ28246.1 hypothetical protein MARPO_0169s0011 [Marchantia polymorpha]